MKLCKCRCQHRQKARETVTFWTMLGIIAGVSAVTIIARWRQKKDDDAPSAEFAPPIRRSTGAAAPPVEAPQPEAEPAVKPKPARGFKGAAPKTPPAADDLTKIEGIGPKISGWLAEAGITTFAQLAAATPEELRQVLLDAGHRIANPDTWPKQAALAAAGRWDELAALQATLKGGRQVS